jgi:hypothetical protein
LLLKTEWEIGHIEWEIGQIEWEIGQIPFVGTVSTDNPFVDPM